MGRKNMCQTAGCLQREQLDRFLESDADGSYYVGHATVLVRCTGKLVLIDPVLSRALFLDSWLFFPPLALDPRLSRVDAVLVSHCHEDHYDPEFLRGLPSGTPIWFTAGRTGFERIIEDPDLNTQVLSPMVFTEIAEGVEVLALPSDHNPFDSSFIVRSARFSLYHGNDNFLPEDTVRRARSVAGPVDHAYIPYAYVWWYPFCLTSISEEKRQAEARRLSERSMSIGRMIASVLEAALVIPSAGNLVFHDSADSVINRGIASPYDYLDYARAAGGEADASRVRILLAADFALHGADEMQIVQMPRTKESFLAEMSSFLEAWNARVPHIAKRLELSAQDEDTLRARVESGPKTDFPTQVWFVRADGPDAALTLDLRSGQVGRRRGTRLQADTMIFRIDAGAFESWIRGAIGLETILNSQRFLLEREPELFDPELWCYLRRYV